MLQSKIAKIRHKRAASNPLPKGSAPYTSSNEFKVRPPGLRPSSRLWSDRFSKECRLQKTSPLKAASRNHDQSDMITLGTARPSPEYYPWESMQMVCPEQGAPGTPIHLQSHVTAACERGEDAYDLAVAMNYGYSAGSPQLLRYITEHVEMIHNPPYEDWESCLTCGSTSSLDLAFRIFCNPGDTVLMESHTYSGAVTTAAAHELNVRGVAMDGLGLLPEDLDKQLKTWDTTEGPKPFVLYMIPTGQNPTGTTQSLERRQAIYQVAEDHDLYIIEDDPYFFLSLEASSSGVSSPGLVDLDQYMRLLPASYLSIDTSGRVLRMDSTSKILAPGLRLGWITASSEVINKFISYSEVGVLSPSGPSQVVVHKLLDETWGHQGFIEWLARLSIRYRQRRDTLVVACKRHFPPEVCTWEIPENGMFLWVDLNISKRTSRDNNGVPYTKWLEIEESIFKQAQKSGVTVSRGSWFITDVTQTRDVSFRLTFAAAPEEDLDRGIERFGHALKI